MPILARYGELSSVNGHGTYSTLDGRKDQTALVDQRVTNRSVRTANCTPENSVPRQSVWDDGRFGSACDVLYLVPALLNSRQTRQVARCQSRLASPRRRRIKTATGTSPCNCCSQGRCISGFAASSTRISERKAYTWWCEGRVLFLGFVQSAPSKTVGGRQFSGRVGLTQSLEIGA